MWCPKWLLPHAALTVSLLRDETVQPGERGLMLCQFPISGNRSVKCLCHIHPRAKGTADSKRKKWGVFAGDALKERNAVCVSLSDEDGQDVWQALCSESLGQEMGLCMLLWFWILPLSFAFSFLLWALTFFYPRHFLSGENAHVIVPCCISICLCSWCFPKLDVLQ